MFEPIGKVIIGMLLVWIGLILLTIGIVQSLME
jgi:hypothetical protein